MLDARLYPERCTDLGKTPDEGQQALKLLMKDSRRNRRRRRRKRDFWT